MDDSPPPTYAELLAENETLKAEVSALRSRVRSIESDTVDRNAELNDLRRRAKKPKRVLDAKAASAFDRPYDGR